MADEIAKAKALEELVTAVLDKIPEDQRNKVRIIAEYEVVDMYEGEDVIVPKIRIEPMRWWN